jgi:hypothetical protein
MISPDEMKLKSFTTHGIEFIGMSGNDYQADCPFCGKHRAFHVDPDTTKWVCSSGLDRCGRTGNLTTFIRQWHAFCFENTSEAQYAALSKHRKGLSPKALRFWKCAYNALTQEWLIPNHEPSGEVHDVRRWRPGRKPMGTPTISAGMWGRHQLRDPSKANWPVWIMEGEFDGMAMWHWLRLCMMRVIPVAVPGANVFKDDWVEDFKDRNVVFWYDNDATGLEYSWKKAKMLYGVAKSVRWHFWPENFPEKYDVCDHYVSQLVQKQLQPRVEMIKMLERIRSEHPSAATDEDAPKLPPPPRKRPASNPTIEETLAVYRKHFKMSRDLEDTVKIMYATVLSQQNRLDVPVWVFIVAPPSTGKTTLLLSLHKVPDVSYHSNITAKALLSGYKEDKKDGDPSVLAKLIAAGVGVFKDFTQLLGKSNEMELQAVSRLLRGAFDGEAEQHFGNGVVRKYKGYFTLLAGVTDEIHGHSEATVGERFLKWELMKIPKRKEKELTLDIIYGSKNRENASDAMQDAALAFLDRDVMPLDPVEVIPRKYALRLSGLARLVATLRSMASWEKDYGYDKILRFRPRREAPYRIARQLTSVALSLCVVNGKRVYGDDEHRLVERLAFNTAIGFNLDIIEAMMGMGGVNVSRPELGEATGIPKSTLYRRLEDMHLLGMCIPSAKQPASLALGRVPEYYDVSPELREIWQECAPNESHMAALARNRSLNRQGIPDGS